jgi:hypothetical protein
MQKEYSNGRQINVREITYFGVKEITYGERKMWEKGGNRPGETSEVLKTSKICLMST